MMESEIKENRTVLTKVEIAEKSERREKFRKYQRNRSTYLAIAQLGYDNEAIVEKNYDDTPDRMHKHIQRFIQPWRDNYYEVGVFMRKNGMHRPENLIEVIDPITDYPVFIADIFVFTFDTVECKVVDYDDLETYLLKISGRK